MDVDDFVTGLFDGGGTHMVGPDGHTNDPGPHKDYDGTVAVRGCPACEGEWDCKNGTFG